MRAFVNAVGCIVGGSRHSLVETAISALGEFAGPPMSTVFGRAIKVDVLNAALFNALSGAAYSFDDTYSDALLHPGVPVASALLALSERRSTDGKTFVTAFAAGLEVACRLTKALTVSPARGEMAWSQTGIVGGLAAALACGKLLGLDEQRLQWALAIAASAAAGTRASHGSMAASMIFGQAAQSGVRAAILAQAGFTGSARPIEHEFGFARLFSQEANLGAITEGLGTAFELISNTYKPFPCGIVIHPALDAVLQLKERQSFEAEDIQSIRLRVSPAALRFANRPDPASDIEAKVSLHHWVAAALVRGKAGISEGNAEAVGDSRIARVRGLLSVVEDARLKNDGADVAITLASGVCLENSVRQCVGSLDKPMSDDALTLKFLDQAGMVLGPHRARQLVDMCWAVSSLDDVGVLAKTGG